MPKGAGQSKGKSPAPGRSRLPCGRLRSGGVQPRAIFGEGEVAALIFYIKSYLPKTLAAGGRPGTGYGLPERQRLWEKVRRGVFRFSGVQRTIHQLTHRWSDVLDREHDLLDLLGLEIPGLAPPRGTEDIRGTDTPAVQDGSTEASAAATPNEPSTAPAGNINAGEQSSSSDGEEAATPAADAATPTALGVPAAVAGGDTPSKLTRKEMAIRARSRKLEAIRAEYQRLVVLAEEEAEARAHAASNAPDTASQPPPAVRRRGPAPTRRRLSAPTSSTAAPPCRCNCRQRVRRLTTFLTTRLAKLEREVRDLNRRLEPEQ